MKPAVNISNYEEFFLLYVDGELATTEKQAVEQFVQQNPHLAEEFDMLQQLKLPAAQMIFSDKETLYKNAGQEINTGNYETHFLLYIDNELNEAGKAAVEIFVLQHPALQEQFMLLKKTKLESAIIECPNKAALYRKEEKERKIVYMRWQRIAVAAVVIGVIALVWIFIPSSSQRPDRPTASGDSETNVPLMPKQIDSNRAVVVQAEKSFVKKEVDTPIVPGTSTIERNEYKTPVNNIAQSLVSANNKIATEPKLKDITARIESQPAIIPNTVANTDGLVKLPAEKNNKAIEMSGSEGKTEAITVKNTEPENNTAPSMQPAVYKMLDVETDDNKKSLYIGSLEINKDKLRGFFRKATGFFRGKVKQQEEETIEIASSNTQSLR